MSEVVYVIWKDYGGGDYSMIAIHKTRDGASQQIRQMFFDAKSRGYKPFWTDEEDKYPSHSSFNSDSYEVEVKAVPLAP